MLGFVEWFDHPDYGFYVDSRWDFENKKWVGPGRMELDDHQRRILTHALTPDEDDKFPYTTILYSAPKKSGKTAILAAIFAWMLEVLPDYSEMYSLANDEVQAASRAFRDLRFHVKHCMEQDEHLPEDERRYPSDTINNLQHVEMVNESFVKSLAKSYRSISGSRHALTGWDELWGYKEEAGRRAWEEMTPIPTVPVSLRVVVTYAGFEDESDLLWDLYIAGVGPEEHKDGKGTPIPELDDLPCWENGKQFTYWDHENRMPWQTDEYLHDQMADPSMRPSTYLRLHENRWVVSHEVFIPIEWYDLAAKSFPKSAEFWPDHPYRTFPVYVAVDAAHKRDSSAVVGLAYDSARGDLIEIFHRIWKAPPEEDEILNLEATVESYLLRMYNKFNCVLTVYDPTHLMQLMLRIKDKGYRTEEYTQSQGNMTEASMALYDAMRSRSFHTFPDEEARRHIQLAAAKNTSRGFRIVKSQSRGVQVDYAVALAMAAVKAIQSGGSNIAKKIKIVSPFADATTMDKTDQSNIPFELRD